MDSIAVDILPPERWYKRARYRLREPVEVLGHAVPAGFITDGASVPRFLSVIAGVMALVCHAFNCTWGVVLFVCVSVAVLYFPPVGRYLVAAIVHDWLLTQVARKIADREFLRVMRWLGIRRWRRGVMYCAVRGFSIVKYAQQRLSQIPSIIAAVL